MRKLLFLIFLIAMSYQLSAISCYGDNLPSVAWQSGFNSGSFDYSYGSASDNTGNIYVAGYCFNGSTNDAVTVKYSPAGDVLWSRVYDSLDNDFAYDVTTDETGNVYAAGCIGYIGAGPATDLLLIKYSPDGDELWVKRYDSGNEDVANGVAFDSAGYICAAGYTGTSPASDYLVIKYDGSGETAWVKTYDSGFDDIGYGAAADSAGSIFITGYSGNGSTYDLLTFKCEQDSAVLWESRFPANNVSGTGFGVSGIKTDAAGNAYVTGNYNYGVNSDYLVIKYSSSGDTLWSRTYDGGSDDVSSRIAVDASGSAYINGYSAYSSSTHFLTVKYNSSGDLVWAKRFDSPSYDYGFGVAVDSSGSVYASGFYSNGSDDDYLLVRYTQHPLTSLKITTPPFITSAGNISSAITVEAWDDTGAVDTSFNGTVCLSTSSPNGRFSADNVLWVDTSIITLASGTAVFYYVDPDTGNPIITVARYSLFVDAQTETIASPVGSIKITSDTFSIRQFDISPGINVEARDFTGALDTLFNETVSLFSSSHRGRFSADAANWIDTNAITLSSGQGIFYYTDIETGNPAITVYREGLTRDIQRETITFRPISIKIISSAFTMTAGNPSFPVIAEAQDETGVRDPAFSGTISLTTDSLSGEFSVDNNSWINTTVINMRSGRAVFYYRDILEGNPVITASHSLPAADSQGETIVKASVDGYASYYRVSKTKAQADGADTISAVVFINDTFGYPVPGVLVTLVSARGNSTSIQPSNQVAGLNGQCTFAVTSLFTGAETISGLCEGLLITENILNNPSFELSFAGETTASWWDFTGDNPGNHTGLWSWTSDAADGAKAMMHSCAGIEDNYLQAQWVRPYRAAYPVYPVTPSTSYSLSQFVKTDLSSGLAGMRVVWFVNVYDTSVITELNAGSVSGSNPWTYISGSIVSPANANGILFRCQNWGVGTAWFDCPRLQRTPTIEFTSSSNFGFAGPFLSVQAGSVSESICIQSQYQSGLKDPSFSGTCTVTTTSATGRFSASQSGPWSGSIAAMLISGETVIYYTDTKSGSLVITVTGPGLSSCTQAGSVAPGPFSETASFILTERSVPADGVSPCTVAVYVTDYYRNPVAGAQVIVTTSRKGTVLDAYDTITQPFAATDANGMCTGVAVSSLDGKDTVTAYISGYPGRRIENTVFSEILAGAWNFEECGGTTARDISGYGNNGTVYNTGGCDTSGWAPGRFGYAMAFDGVDDHVSVPDPADNSLDPPDQITIELWFRTGNMDQGDKYLVGKVASGIDGYRIGGVNGSAVYMQVPTSGWNYGLGSSASVTADTWVHFAGVYDGSMIRIYLNGIPSGTLAKTGGIYNSALNLSIGSFNNATAVFTGLIDDVRIYNKALSADEIMAGYLGRARPVDWIGASKVKIVTPPRSFQAGSVSDSIAAQAQWADGTPAAGFSGSCVFSSPSGNGWFAPDPSGPWSKSLTLRLAGGETFAYYKDIKAGSQSIKVSISGLGEDSQAQSVSAGVFSETCSFIVLNSGLFPADGTSACTVTVFAADIYRNPVPGAVVVVTTSRKGTADDAYDTITYPWGQTTDAAGTCTAALVSLLSGTDTVTAYLQGDMSRRISNTVISDGLAGMWNFDEGTGFAAGDNSRYSNSGTVTNPVWVEGRYGPCLYFDNVSGPVRVPNSISLNPRNAISVEAWAKLDPTESFEEIVRKEPSYMLRREDAGEGKQFNFFIVSGGGWEPRADSGMAPDSGTNSPWYHLAGTYDKDGGTNNLKLYVNGALSAQATKTGTIDASASDLLIGGVPAFWNGLVDEMRIYSRAMPQDEISRSYSGTPKPVLFTGVADRIVITTPERTVIRGSISDYITVEVRDSLGQRSTGFSDTVSVSSSSATGRFSPDMISWSASNNTSIMVSGGSADLYYKDSVAETCVITVSRQGLASDTQFIFVLPSPPASGKTSYLGIPELSRGLPADGKTACTVSVFVKDKNGSALEGKQVTLFSSRAGSDTITQPGLTDAAGQCTALVVAIVDGGETLFAVCDGETIYENIVNNPSFENGAAFPDSWNINADTWTWASDVPYSGAKAMRNYSDAVTDQFVEARWSGTPYPTRWTVTGSTSFYVSQHTRTDLLSGDAYIRMIWFRDDSVLGEEHIGSVTGNQTWTLLSATITSPSNANGLMFRSQNAGLGTAWFDCMSCRRVPTVVWNNAEKLGLTTPPRAITAGAVSDSIAIQAQWGDGSPALVYNGSASVLSSSAAGRFSAGVSGPWSATLTVNLVNGETTVYYRDTKAGSPVITVSQLGLAPCTQVQSVTALGVFSETNSWIVIPSGCASDGISPCAVKVFIVDAYFNPVQEKTVIITTSRKGTAEDGYDTVTQPAGLTGAGGMAEGSVVSTLEGKDTISASVAGEPGKIIRTVFLNTAPAGGRWDFDEGSGDIAYSHVNSGKITGASRAPGMRGNCLSFNGSSDYVEVPDADSLDPSRITVELWFRTDNGFQGDKYLLNRVVTGSEGYRIGGVNGNAVAWNVPVTGWNYSLGASGIPINEWVHLVTTYDGAFMKIFVNGIESAGTARTGPVGNSPSALFIGAFNSGTACFTGMIDDVRIYDRALTADEIKACFAGRQKPVTWVSAAKIAFVTPQRAIQSGSASDSICVQAQWADGSKAGGYAENCEFSSSSPNGLFCASQSGTWAPSMILKMTGGETFVYYKDTISGSPVITVKANGLPDTAQVESILAGTFSDTLSYMWLGPSRIPADGISQCIVNVFVKDAFGNVLEGRIVTIGTSRGYSDTAAQPGATDANGMCTGSITSSLMGDVNVTAYCSGKAITASVLRDVCVGMWPLDEGSGSITKDFSPSASTGYLLGASPPVWVDGKYGKALEFNGTSPGNYVQGAYPLSMRIHLDNIFTYSAWVKVYSGSQWGTIFRGPAGNPGIEITGNGSIRLLSKTAAGWPDHIVYYNAPVNSWIHVVFTGNGASYGFYLNGEKKQAVNATAFVDEGQAVWMIGGRGDAWNLQGCVDDVMLIDKCLTDTEVLTQYQLRLLPVRFIASSIKMPGVQFRAKSGVPVAVSAAAVDSSDNTDTSFSDNADILSSSANGSFSKLPSPWSAINSVTFSGGAAAFYYKDLSSGFPVITVQKSGMVAGAQQGRITASKLKITTPQYKFSSTRTSDTVTVAARDEMGSSDPGWNETLSLSSNSTAGRFSLNRSPWVDTSVAQMSAGTASFFFKNTRGGTSSVAVVSSDIADTQFETVTMPVIRVLKWQRKEGGETTVSPVTLRSGDSVEWTVIVRNAGTETAVNVWVIDRSVFDTTAYNSVVFISSDPSQSDSSYYTTDPALAVWVPGSPPAFSENVKGLRWFVNTLGINERRAFKLKVRAR